MRLMSQDRTGLGRRGEQLAAAALLRHGFTIVARNWRCQAGEADLIARRDNEWYFFEVRTRRGLEHGLPEESLKARKQARMEAVARHYLSALTPPVEDQASWHLGFVAVALDKAGRVVRLTLYPDLNGEPVE